MGAKDGTDEEEIIPVSENINSKGEGYEENTSNPSPFLCL